MDNKLEYYKEFWMFNRENDGISINNVMNGYAKIEVKNSQGYINLFVSGVTSNLKYDVYLMKTNNFKSLYLGTLKVNKNMGILIYKFNPSNVGNTGYDITNFNIIAVVNIIKNNQDITIMPQAVAYKNKHIPWMESLKKALLKPLWCVKDRAISHNIQNKLFTCNKCQNNNPKINFYNIMPKIPVTTGIYNIFNVEIFKRQMDINFRRCNPFSNVRQDYIWWDIQDINKLYYFCKMFNIQVANYPTNGVILGLYKNNQKTYVVVGFLLTDNNCKGCFDKIVDVKNSKLNLKYGLIFKNPYQIEKVN